MRTQAPGFALAILVTITGAGCSDRSGSVARASPSQPVSTAVGVYARAAPINHPLQHYTLASRFVLREDGTFSLEYPTGAYRGTYSVRTNEVLFEWEGRSVAGPWAAAGTLTERTLTVRYNVIIGLRRRHLGAHTMIADRLG